MPAPWEKYGGKAAPAAAGPWAKYGGTEKPSAPYGVDPATNIPNDAPAPPNDTVLRAGENGVLQPTKVEPAYAEKVAASSADPSPRILPDFDLHDLWTAITGAPEAAAGMANNAIVAGAAGLSAPFVAKDSSDAADYVRDFTAENSYHPHGENASKLTGAVGEAFAPVEGAKRGLGDTIMEATNSPALATTGYMGPDLATILLGPKAAGPETDLTKPGANLAGGPVPKPRPAARANPDDPVATARAAGVKLLPSDVERVTLKKPGLGDRFAEAIAPEGIRRDMTVENQGKFDQLQREKVGAPEGTRLDTRGIDKQKEPHFKVYEDVNKAINVVPPSSDYLFALDEATQRAGFPKGSNPSVTEVISALRTKARRKINNPNADDKLEAEGRLAGEAADKLEEAMGTELKNVGNEELLPKYQAARQSLAELNDAERTQRGGHVDPQKVYKLDQKNKGKMTGQTKMIADIGEKFPEARSVMTGAGKKGSTGKLDREHLTSKIVKTAARGAVKGLSKVIPPLGDRLLVDSEGFQNRIGPEANATERTYFSDYGKRPEAAPPKGEPPAGAPPSQGGVVPSKAVTLSGRLGLEPEPVQNPQKLPETPSRLTADMLRPTESGGVSFKPTNMAESDLSLADDLPKGEGVPYKAHPLADQIMGSADLKVAPREMEQLDFHPPSVEQPRRLDLEPPPGTVRGKPTKPGRRIKVNDSGEDLGDMLANNASGESSASLEAVNRVRDEKKGGRERFVIDLDDTVTPLTGVDAVDRRARKGQVIVQRGVGKDEYTILDRGGLTAQHAKGRIQAAFSRLKEALEPPRKTVTE